MISATLVALSAFVLSASAQAPSVGVAVNSRLQSGSPSFAAAGIQGCISVAENADGEPLVIHNCNTQDPTLQLWNGTYAIRGDTAPGPITAFGNKCIDVVDGVNADGAKLQIWTCSGGPNQKFIHTLANTWQWAGSNKCIDLTGGRITDGTELQLYTCDASNTNTNQRWQFTDSPQTAGPKVFLGGNPQVQPGDLAGEPFCAGAASDADGADVVLLGCGVDNFGTQFPGGNFTWSAPDAPLSGTVKLYNNKCLDVRGGSTANGARLQIWTCAAGNTNQQFTIHSASVEWKGTGKCFDLLDGKSVIGTPIQLWDCATNGNLNQVWVPTQVRHS